MMESVRKYLPVYVLVIAGLITSAFAVPVFSVTVQQLGQGDALLVSPANSATTNFIFDTADPSLIVGVTVSFDQNLPAGTIIHVQIHNSTGAIITQGSVTLSTNLTAGTPITINFATSVKINTAEDVEIVVQGPQV